jgi:hypothetical protein
MHPVEHAWGQRTTKIVQAAAFEFADNALTRRLWS